MNSFISDWRQWRACECPHRGGREGQAAVRELPPIAGGRLAV